MLNNISAYLADISVISYIAVFIGGVITSFTPCIYPLIPIMVGVIGASKEKSPLNNFFISLSYVSGMAIVFSVLAMIAGLTGSLFGRIQSSPIANIIVGGIIIVFALILLDIFPMPTAMLSRAGAGKIIKGKGILPAFLMGLVSGLIAAPCASAVLGALLVFVASKGNPVFGFTLLFTFAMGLGTFLIIIGTFTGVISRLPRSEKTMRALQKLLALAMIALGAYFIFKAGTLSI